MTDTPQIFPLGDCALTIRFGNEISPASNDRVLRLADHIDRNPFIGFIETVPAYASLTVFYDVPLVRKTFTDFATAYEAVSAELAAAQIKLSATNPITARTIEIPASFETDDSPDLDFVAAENKLSTEKVIELFTERTYRVYMLGFLPGFAYMGEIDARIAVPRRSSPRPNVPKGSIGIAGRQTGIYSMESPGGWQIIGRTDVELFTPGKESPTYLKTGDVVKFRACRS